MICPICESEHRHQIDLALLNGDELESVITSYAKEGKKFTMDQLKIHAVCHLKRTDTSKESIATKLAFSEAEALVTSCNEYMVTQQRLGSVISKQLTLVEDGELAVGAALSKSLVDLYLGTGKQINEAVKLLTDAYADMNADEGGRANKSGLALLSSALDRSRQELGGKQAVS